MEFNKSANFFSNNYDSILNENRLGVGSKVYIGEKGGNCRFCGKNTPETEFKTIAHAVPEFLGNKRFILRNECDQCNDFFSNNLEVHLDKFTRVYRLIAKIKGKSKIPSYKSKDNKTRVNSSANGPAHVISPENSGFYSIDTKNCTINQKFDL